MSNIILPNEENGNKIIKPGELLFPTIDINQIQQEPDITEKDMGNAGFKDPRAVNDLKYIIKDILSGDPKAAKRPEYTSLGYEQMKTAIKWLEQQGLDDATLQLLLEKPYLLTFKDKPPTPDEFLTSKYIGSQAESVWWPVRKNFLQFFDPLKPYRTAVLNPSIGSGKPLPYSETCKGCLKIIDIEDDNGDIYHIPKNDKIKVIIDGKKYDIYAKDLEKFSSKKVDWYRKSTLIKYMKNYVIGNFKELEFKGTTYNELILFFKKIDKEYYTKNNIYIQKHHIVPKSEGGNDDSDNLVYLPYKYHMMAHYLRGKELEQAGYKKAAFANYKAVLYALNENSIPKTIKDFSSKIDFVVEALQKRKDYEKQSIWITNGLETKRQLKDEKIPDGWRKGRTFKSPATKKWVNKDGKNFYVEENELEEYLKNGYSIGMFKTEKMKKANHSSYSTLGTVWINKDGKNKSVKKELLDEYLNDGWRKGHIFKSAETAKSRKMYNPQTGKTRSTKVHLIEKYISKGWILGGKPD